ncbi:MAG: FAD-dependent oxidoreductase, partial [Kiritimatiellae bacterium]|nr:FAD-dependent oxidoreductase [Kiritimatiellia bacterium]
MSDTQTRIVVIGGSAAGPKAASKARRMDQHASITLIQKSKDLSMASCGYPYYVGGTFDDRNKLLCTPTGVTRDPDFFIRDKDITAITETEVTSINRDTKTVTCKNIKSGEETTVAYDKLVISTGASPIIPPVPGTDLEGITTLQSMRDADYLRKIRDEKKIENAVVVGGGLIGIETCEALNLAGINITVVEMLPQILMFLDWELAKILENHIKAKASQVVTENPVAEFLGKDGKLCGVKLRNGTELPCELAVISTGVRPNGQLAEAAGLEMGERGCISVNEYMQTS